MERIENYKDLCNAVVLRAFDDYILARAKEICLIDPNWSRSVSAAAVQNHWEGPNAFLLRDAMAMRRECERFFLSNYYRLFSDVSGQTIVDATEKKLTWWINGEIDFRDLVSVGLSGRGRKEDE